MDWALFHWDSLVRPPLWSGSLRREHHCLPACLWALLAAIYLACKRPPHPGVFPFPGAPVILALGGGASQGLQAGDRAGLSSRLSPALPRGTLWPCQVKLTLY